MLKNFKDNLRDLRLGIFEKILLFLPFFIWFSYQPNFNFGKISGANIEFSLLQIYLVFLVLSGLSLIFKNWQKLIKDKGAILAGLFILWNILSIFWSENTSRAILTSAVLLLLYIIFLEIISLKKLKKLARILAKLYVISAVFMSFFAIFQVIYGAWTDEFLCRGCSSLGFGFVRPSGFTIEPQFFGSLLITPILILFHEIFTSKLTKIRFFMLFVMLTALYLTLSRGAIFALVLAVLFYAFTFFKNKKKVKFNLLFSVLIIGISFFSGLIIHGIFTQLNPRVSDTFYDSISKSVNQMSMGIIKFPAKKIDNSGENPAEKTEESAPKAAFDGYVPESTNERTSMANLALETWRKDLPTVFFGVGVGGSGRAIYQYTAKTPTEAEIVQNEYLEILLELGIIGFVLFLVIIVSFFVHTRSNKLAWAIFIGFLIQWNFFSGMPNSLHLYLILAILFGIIDKAYEKKPRLNRRVRSTKSS